jgi:hypothetical protein
MTALRATLVTSSNPGAIALIVITGEVAGDLGRILRTRIPDVGRSRLVAVSGIDEVLVARVREETVFLMPHAGPRVVHCIMALLDSHGVVLETDPAAESIYPEAQSKIEARMLDALARATSPLAIDILLDQPALWSDPNAPDRACASRDQRLGRLLQPPIVAIVGRANVGKSTLTNRLADRDCAIALDLPGTTRDPVSCRIDLHGLVVNWIDMPGVRATTDPLEDRAIEHAKRWRSAADCIITVTDHEQPWLEDAPGADLRISLKADVGTRSDADLGVSAVTGEGIETLVGMIRDRLLPPEDLTDSRPWRFW